MAAATLSEEEILDLIGPARLAEKNFRGPRRVIAHADYDHAGEPAFHVVFVYPNNTPESSLDWHVVKPMVRWARQELWRAGGEERFPYIRVAREKDLVLH